MNNQPMVQVTIPQITIMLFFICLVQSSTLSYSSTARTMECVFTTINSNNLTHIEIVNRFLNSSISSILRFGMVDTQ
ncbi:unnamed protein product, partial [Rotaria magnacalcarata]